MDPMQQIIDNNRILADTQFGYLLGFGFIALVIAYVVIYEIARRHLRR
jgi:hypothetical protein